MARPPAFPSMLPTARAPETTIEAQHRVLVSIAILLLGAVVASEVAQKSKSAAHVVMLILVGLVLILGIKQGAALTKFKDLPWLPGKGVN